MKIFIKKGYGYFALLACLAMCIAAVVFSRECAAGIKRGIELSLSQLVPSLFFIIILADFAVKSGILNTGGKIFSRVAGLLFGVSSYGLWAILLSTVGGYPVGARLAASMYEEGKISADEAKFLANFCVCAGPGFLINFTGEFLLGDKAAGFILFVCQALSVLILGILSKVIFRRRAPKYVYRKTEKNPLGEALVSSVNSGTKVIVGICATVTAFSGFLGLIEAIAESGGPKMLVPVLTALLEVTTACRELASQISLPALGFITGFGGFCVHFQIFGILSKVGVSKPKFLLYRLIQGIITTLLILAAGYIFPQTVEVFSTLDSPPEPSGAATLIGGAALLFTSLLFIFTVWRKRLCAE